VILCERERVDVLRKRIPGLYAGGSVLYVGAMPGRCQGLRQFVRAGSEVTLLEIWPEYAEHYKDDERVAHVVTGDVREIAAIELPHEQYDVAFWWHGPEHVAFDDIAPALAAVEERARLVVIGCPWGEYEHGPQDGNPHQAHLSTIYPADLRRWGYRVATIGAQGTRGKGCLIGWRERGQELPRIIAAVIAFNEERMLPGCLESVQGQVDLIVVVDGAYAKFPHTVPWSSDATKEIALAYDALWISTTEAWESQVAKRSAYLIGQEGDWYLHIDADERLIGTLPVPQDGQHYTLQIHSRSGRLGWSPRLFQHRGWMRYEGSHNGLWSDEWLIHLSGATQIDPEECTLLHLAQLRDEQRQLDKRRYYGWQKPHERPYRSLHGI
jgi:hypothetical protein